MKLTAILLFVICMQVAARTNGQNVTLKVKNAPMKEVFREIQKQTGLDVLVDEGILQKTGKVTLDVKDVPVADVLNLCLKNQPLSYTITDGRIVIKPKPKETGAIYPPDLSLLRNEPPPPIDISGRVTDADGNPLAGANVKVKGSDKGTTTNNDGVFVLKGVDENATLEISFVGYEVYTVAVNNKTSVVASLKLKAESLDEVIVNKGYYTEKQRLSTGNVSTVKAVDIERQPVNNVLAALQGRVPGMLITQQTGVPGGGFSVQIRGRNSIDKIQVTNDPLYIIDGVPYTSALLPNSGIGASIIGLGNPLNYINPDDIESVDVLKDADATAIYGSRGANGVVLITTKKGKVGNTKVDFNVCTGIGKVSHYVDLLNTQQFLEMRREAFNNDGGFMNMFNAPDLLKWDTTSYTDWQKVLIGGTAHYTNVQSTVSGGNTNVQYLIGAGYQKETTVFPGDFNDQKGNVHFNINGYSPSRRFNISLSGNYMLDNNNLFKDDLTNISNLAPNAPYPLNADGSLNWASSLNPFANLRLKYKIKTNNLIGNSVISYRILDGLQLKANLGYTYMQVKEVQQTPIAYYNPSFNRSTGSSVFTNNNIQSWIIEPQLNYQRHFNKGKLDVLLGSTFHQNMMDGQVLTATGFTSDALLSSIKAASSVSVSSATDILYKYNAVFGRINYNSQDKYLLNLTGRRDGTSRFGPDKQFHDFWAIGSGWIFSNTAFFQKHLSVISFGKLRFSYGTTGNDQVGDYRFLDLYNTTMYPYQGVQGLYPNNLFNPDLAWEENRKLEAAIEIGLFHDRIYFTANAYRNRCSNQLLSYPLPDITGFSSVATNLPATVQNTGWEFEINTVNVKTSKLTWSTSANLTIPHNKLISYPGLENSTYKTVYIVGQPLTIQRVYDLTGVDQQSGVYLFKDAQGNNTTSPSFLTDKFLSINTAPKFYGGIENSFNYKGFQLNFFFQFVKQTGRNYLFSNFFSPGSSPYYNAPKEVFNRWGKAGDNASFQKFTSFAFFGSTFESYQYAQESNYAYSDASFIRLKNVSVSYSLPVYLKQRLKLQNCRIYLQGQNLFTITKYLGMDPENQSTLALPPLRIITAGIQVTL